MTSETIITKPTEVVTSKVIITKPTQYITSEVISYTTPIETIITKEVSPLPTSIIGTGVIPPPYPPIHPSYTAIPPPISPSGGFSASQNPTSIGTVGSVKPPKPTATYLTGAASAQRPLSVVAVSMAGLVAAFLAMF